MSCSQRTKPSSQILQTTRFEESRSAEAPRIGQQEGRDFPSRQRSVKHIFVHPRKTTRVFLECFAIRSPYSHDLAPSDYHLFRSLQNSLDEKNFPNPDAIKIHLERFFAEKFKTFREKGILDLPNRWLR